MFHKAESMTMIIDFWDFSDLKRSIPVESYVNNAPALLFQAIAGGKAKCRKLI